jgi:hypothetical protein
MTQNITKIRVAGKEVNVPTVGIDGHTVIVTGRWIKIAEIHDYDWIDGELEDPQSFLQQLKEQRPDGCRADIFTFAEKLPNILPRHRYHLGWDSLAVTPTTSYTDWWENRAKPDVRKAVKKATKRGVVVREAEFNDAFVHGIVEIYNDSPVRQGKPFWHYQKDFEAVKAMNSTYLDRSTFIGAYCDDELIGFIKMLKVGSIAMTVQVISKTTHFDKKPTNALIAKAVEICAEKKLSQLIYGGFVHHGLENSLTEFKRRNGFEEVRVPRYYAPLTPLGRFMLLSNLHQGVSGILPPAALRMVVKAWRFSRKACLSKADVAGQAP